jgi:hypothetical protein
MNRSMTKVLRDPGASDDSPSIFRIFSSFRIEVAFGCKLILVHGLNVAIALQFKIACSVDVLCRSLIACVLHQASLASAEVKLYCPFHEFKLPG